MKRFVEFSFIALLALVALAAALPVQAQSPDDEVTLYVYKPVLRGADAGFVGDGDQCKPGEGSDEGCLNSLPPGIRERCNETRTDGLNPLFLQGLFCRSGRAAGSDFACVGATQDVRYSEKVYAACSVPRSVAEPIWESQCRAIGGVSAGDGTCRRVGNEPPAPVFIPEPQPRSDG